MGQGESGSDPMTFVLRMVLREMRASWKRLTFFFVCVAVGVGAIVALRSVIQGVRAVLTAEAKTLSAADVLIRTRRPWTEEGRDIIDRTLESTALLGQVEAIETATMARPADETKAVAKVVELLAVQAEFPLYGQVVLQGGQPYSHALLERRGALVRPELLIQLGVEVGDEIVIGDDLFSIRGVILREPGGGLGAFSLGPRVLIDYDALQQTGLTGFASRAQRQILLKVAEDAIQPLVRQLRENLRGEFVSVRSYRGAEDRITRNLLKAENYLSLTGFVVVILGGIGVWSVTRVFVQQRMRSIAIMKCLGSTTRQILMVYLVQVMLLGLGGSLLGVGLAGAALAAVPGALTERAAAAAGLVEISPGLTTSAVVQGVGIGILVSMLFSLVPLLEVRHIKPLLLLRWGLVRSPAGIDWVRLGAVALIGAALVVLASWQAASLEVGVYVCGGFAGIAVALHVAAAGLVRAVRPLGSAGWFPLRHAVINLSRPGSQTRVILLAVGLGTFSIIGVRALQANLLQELALELREDSPDMFLIDIQQDQVDDVRELVASRNGDQMPQFIPVLRARVVGVTGRELNVDGFEEVRRLGSLAREYTITYRDRLEANERIIAGQFWNGEPTAAAEVSIDESLERRFGIHVGDTVRFDVLGRAISAHVTSVRVVDWDDSRSGGFMFLFRPGAFDKAPHTFIVLLKGPSDVRARARMQRDLVSRFPNVLVIDGFEILNTVRLVLDYVTLAISSVGAIAAFSGVLILVGSVAMTKFQRLYEAAILKTLGATTKTIMTMLVLEYGVLGTLAGAVGSGGALVLSWVLSTYLFEIRWYAAPVQILGGIVLTALAVGVVGIVSSLDVLSKRPLGTLRAE